MNSLNEFAIGMIATALIMTGFTVGIIIGHMNGKTGHVNCPFCGAGSDYVFPVTANETNVYICCGKCDATGPVAEGSTTQAWELWRTRV